MNIKDDWRFLGQDEYLLGVKLRFKKYTTFREGWDHDHCSFCGSKFSVIMPDCLQEGYTTENDYYWICTECYRDFNEYFKWNLVD